MGKTKHPGRASPTRWNELRWMKRKLLEKWTGQNIIPIQVMKKKIWDTLGKKCNKINCAVLSYSVMSNSLGPHRMWLTRVLCSLALQARTLEWVFMPSSRGSSQTRDQTQVSCTAGGFFTICATREAHKYWRVTYPFSRGSSQSRNRTRVSCICRWIFHQLSYQESLRSTSR